MSVRPAAWAKHDADLYETFFSDGSADFVDPPGPHRIDQLVTIRLRALQGVRVRSVKIRTFPDGEERLVEMVPAESPPFRVWSARVKLSVCPFRYRFRVETDHHVLWRNAAGLERIMPPDDEDYRLLPGYVPPVWVAESVMYQIFPDRFHCGRPETALAPRALSPASRPAVVKRWHEMPGRPNFGHDFFGGDLWGVGDKLAHLERLGVNTIYFTPVFAALSNHRYDTTDYTCVDGYHVGRAHPWFQDAIANANGEFRPFFTFSEYPEKYVSWLGHTNLPKLDFACERVHDLIYRGPDAIGRAWLRAPYRASGWRLDVANMVGVGGTDRGNLEIWRAFRRAVREERPDAYLLGECFYDGHHWLQGDAFDAVMNYKGFTMPLIQWLAGSDLHLHPAEIQGVDLARWMTNVMARIPFVIRNQMYNPLSSHDIVRFIHRVAGNEKVYRLALMVQMAWPGTPAIYYGEEIALDGGADPDNRRPMPWDAVTKQEDLIEFVARLVRYRRRSAVLQRGAFAWLAVDDDAVAFARFLGGEFVIVAANRGSRPTRLRVPLALLGLPDGMPLREVGGIGALRTVQERAVTLHLGAREGVWLTQA